MAGRTAGHQAPKFLSKTAGAARRPYQIWVYEMGVRVDSRTASGTVQPTQKSRRGSQDYFQRGTSNVPLTTSNVEPKEKGRSGLGGSVRPRFPLTGVGVFGD